MALVKFPDSFLKMTGGIDQVELKAETVRDLNAKLVSKWPQLSEDLEHSALSIDGYIYIYRKLGATCSSGNPFSKCCIY